jgi:hypothetical protein
MRPNSPHGADHRRGSQVVDLVAVDLVQHLPNQIVGGSSRTEFLAATPSYDYGYLLAATRGPVRGPNDSDPLDNSDPLRTSEQHLGRSAAKWAGSRHACHSLRNRCSGEPRAFQFGGRKVFAQTIRTAVAHRVQAAVSSCRLVIARCGRVGESSLGSSTGSSRMAGTTRSGHCPARPRSPTGRWAGPARLRRYGPFRRGR